MMPEVLPTPPDASASTDRNVPDENGLTEAALPPAHLGRSLRAGLRSIWDRLGMVLLLSLAGTIVLLLSLTLGLLLPHRVPSSLRTFGAALLAVTALSPLIAASFDVAYHIAAHRQITFDSFRQGVRQFGGVAVRLGWIHLSVGALAALNITFYLQIGGLAGRSAVILCLYLLLFWSAMALYQGPLLVLQETGAFDEPGRAARRGAKAVLRRSFFLVVGEPLFSLGLWIAALLWTAVTLVTAVGAAMLWLGGVCLLTTAPTRALLAKYGVGSMAEGDDAPLVKEI